MADEKILDLRIETTLIEGHEERKPQSRLYPYHVILASTSPRRRDFLEQCNVSYQLCDISIQEVFDPLKDPDYSQYSMRNAYEKAYVATQKVLLNPLYYGNPDWRNTFFLAADTIVVSADETQLLEKPHDFADACKMLKILSASTHKVWTGYCIWVVNRDMQAVCVRKKSVLSRVTFRSLEDAEIAFYVNNSAPYDKSGAYTIQDGTSLGFIEAIEGSYSNVVGLPMAQVLQDLSSVYSEQQGN